MKTALSTIGFLAFIGFGIFQVVLGYMGIEHHLGTGWAIAAVAAAVVLRFSFPLTVGTYFGVVDVLGWHWTIALVIALPGLLFMLPGLAAALLAQGASFIRRDKTHAGIATPSLPAQDDVTLTLNALWALRPLYNSQSPYDSLATTDAFNKAEALIQADHADVIEAVQKNGRHPTEIALTTLWNISNEELSTGHNHIYRGTLSGKGAGYLYVYNTTVDTLLNERFIDRHEAQSNKEAIKDTIKAAG